MVLCTPQFGLASIAICTFLLTENSTAEQSHSVCSTLWPLALPVSSLSCGFPCPGYLLLVPYNVTCNLHETVVQAIAQLHGPCVSVLELP